MNYSKSGAGRPVCRPSTLCSASGGPGGAAHGGSNNGSFVQQGWAYASLDPADPTGVPTVMRGGVYNGSSALPYQGRYPSGSLFYKGVWYYGTYALAELWGSAQYPCKNWCVQGPFVGFRYSTDEGRSWTEPRPRMAVNFRSYDGRRANLFGEAGPVCDGHINNTTPLPTDPCMAFMNSADCSPYTCLGTWRGKVKFGAAHVVDLGEELEYSPDGRAYMIGHGASKAHQPHSWMQGSEVYLARTKVAPSPEVMSDGKFWEYYGGRRTETRGAEDGADRSADGSADGGADGSADGGADGGVDGGALWVDSVDDARPLFAWENKTGVVTMSYAKALGRYLMVVGTPTERSGVGSMGGTFDFYVLEAAHITGPFRMVSYLAAFGPQAYFVNLPTFALAGATKVQTGWGGDEAQGSYLEGGLSYSANFGLLDKSLVPNPPGSRYSWMLLPVRLMLAARSRDDMLESETRAA